MKKIYLEPSVQVERFQAEDVITASSGYETPERPLTFGLTPYSSKDPITQG